MEENNNQKNEVKENTKKVRTRSYVVITVAVIALIVIYVIFRGSYLENLEIGENYISVFWQNVKYMSITVIANFIFIYVVIYFTNLKIKQGLKEFFDQEKKQMPKFLNKTIAFISAIVVSAATSGIILEKAMLCFNSAQFGTSDPVLGIDIGYFVFQKPFIELIIWYLIILVGILSIYIAAYYIITFNMFFEGIDRKMLKQSKLVKQLSTYVMIIAILLAALVFVNTQSIGTDKFLTLQDGTSSYSLYGAGFTDVKIKLWGYRVLSLVIIVSVYFAIKALKEGKTKRFLLDILIVPSYMLILFLIMVIFQAIFVKPNELDNEKNYIEANIKYTKNAYGIDIQEISLDSDTEVISSQDLEKYEDVINNIAIVSKDIVLKDLNTSQTAKGYYSYRDTQIGKYPISGKDQLVYISPRELVNSIGTYNKKTYEYTHGYGIIVTSATNTKENGTLNHMQKGFKNDNEIVTIKEPRIYFGMQTNDTIVTDNNKNEFDYPVLDSEIAENAENNYNGKAGLSLNFIDKLILSIKEGNLNLTFSSNVNENSKILSNRNIIKRAQTIMPYLIYDENPYMVVTDEGRMIWVLDAYTTSNNYPYSQKTLIRENATSRFEINYIRNSVKVLVDSYDGTIKFYITDRNDPIAMAYRNIYPDLFVDLDEKIPTNIAEHFTYPKYLYNVQSSIIKRYHNVQPDVLYRNDDIWETATYNPGRVMTKAGTDIEPYYTMFKLQDEGKESFGLLLPYTPKGRQNIVSYLVGNCENDGTNKLKIYKYQADSNLLGTMQLDTQIEQDATIMKEIESLNANGIKVTKNILIVPLDNTLLYVEPIYTQYINETEALPTLKKVVVASGSRVAIGNNLKEALNNLVSKKAVEIEVENTDTIDDLVDTIIKANHNLTNSNSSNNWEMMGKDVQKMQELIEKLEVLVQEQKSKKEAENTAQNELNTNTITELENVTNQI